jgi:hypothetical protein
MLNEKFSGLMLHAFMCASIMWMQLAGQVWVQIRYELVSDKADYGELRQTVTRQILPGQSTWNREIQAATPRYGSD